MRRLAAILVADAVGYSKAMEESESAAVASLENARAIIDPAISKNSGRIVATAGDSVVAEFSSTVLAVQAAVEFQENLARAPETETFRFRVGVHFGDVLVRGSDLIGDGVNVAARLESIAPAGGVCISTTVAEQIAGKVEASFAPAGKHRVKNISRPLEVWCWPASAAGRLLLQSRVRLWPLALTAAAAGIVVAAVVLNVSLQKEASPALPTGPRLAIIPFEQLGTPGQDAYFAEGLSRDVNSLLSKFSNLFVLAPGAAAAYRNIRGCSQIRNALGADFILSGSVQRTSNKLRVTTRLTNAKTCRELAAPGPFDRDLDASNVLDVQLEIARKVAAEIGSSDAPILGDDLIEKIKVKAPENLTSYDCVLLSYWFYENFEPDRHRKARRCLEAAVQADPEYSLAWSRLAFAFIESEKYAIDTAPDWAKRAWEAAQKAIELDPNNPDAYYALAIRSQMLRERREVFRNYARRAIKLNSNDSFILADLGTWMAYNGEWEKGKEWVTRAMALNPRHQSWWYFIWQLHAFLQDDYAKSIEYAHRVNLPRNHMVQAALAAAYAMNGQKELADKTLAVVLKLKPDFAKDPRQPYRTRNMVPALIEGIMQGLQRAGLDVPPAAGD